jgi:hypothetical protein
MEKTIKTVGDEFFKDMANIVRPLGGIDMLHIDSEVSLVDQAIELYKKNAETENALKTIKASLRMIYMETESKELHGTKQFIKVSDKNNEAYIDKDSDVVIDTNNYNPTSVLKALKRAVEDGKVSKRTLERCRKPGTKKVPLIFPVSK